MAKNVISLLLNGLKVGQEVVSGKGVAPEIGNSLCIE